MDEDIGFIETGTLTKAVFLVFFYINVLILTFIEEVDQMKGNDINKKVKVTGEQKNTNIISWIEKRIKENDNRNILDII